MENNQTYFAKMMKMFTPQWQIYISATAESDQKHSLC